MTNQLNELKTCLHPGTLCTLLYHQFYEQMQCNALNIKTTTKEVWLYFIHGTTQPGHVSTTTNIQVALNTPQNPFSNQATLKKYLANFPTQKNPGIQNFNLPKSPLIIPFT